MVFVSAYGMMQPKMTKRKNPAAVALGRLGGKAKVPKGAAMLSESERRERGKQAAAKRWKGHKAKRPASARKKPAK
jgi:hypothetical protein